MPQIKRSSKRLPGEVFPNLQRSSNQLRDFNYRECSRKPIRKDKLKSSCLTALICQSFMRGYSDIDKVMASTIRGLEPASNQTVHRGAIDGPNPPPVMFLLFRSRSGRELPLLDLHKRDTMSEALWKSRCNIKMPRPCNQLTNSTKMQALFC